MIFLVRVVMPIRLAKQKKTLYEKAICKSRNGESGDKMREMMVMNFFCGLVDQREAFRLISSRDHRQRSSPSRISNTLRTGFEPAQNLSSGFFE